MTEPTAGNIGDEQEEIVLEPVPVEVPAPEPEPVPSGHP
jgi:hypothetical protein